MKTFCVGDTVDDSLRERTDGIVQATHPARLDVLWHDGTLSYYSVRAVQESLTNRYEWADVFGVGMGY